MGMKEVDEKKLKKGNCIMNRQVLETDDAIELLQGEIEAFSIDDNPEAASACWTKVMGKEVEVVAEGVRVTLTTRQVEAVVKVYFQDWFDNLYYDPEQVAMLLNTIRPQYDAEAIDDEHCEINEV